MLEILAQDLRVGESDLGRPCWSVLIMQVSSCWRLKRHKCSASGSEKFAKAQVVT